MICGFGGCRVVGGSFEGGGGFLEVFGALFELGE